MECLSTILCSKVFLIIAILTTMWVYFKFVLFDYWKRKGVPFDEPIIPFGSALPMVIGKMSMGNFIKQKYEESKKHPFYGIYMFHQPTLLINDLDLVRTVLIKEFNKFCDRGLYCNEEIDPISSGIFLMSGDKWRKSRTKLSPIFTTGKLKQMYPLMLEIGNELVKACEKIIQKDSIGEFKDLIGRYSTDSISSIAFGYNCNSLDDPDNEFQKYGSLVFDQPPIRYALGSFAPIFLDLLRIPLIPRKVGDFFAKTFTDMVIYRRRNKIVRNDFMNLLMQLMDNGVLSEDAKSHNVSNDDKISMAEARAQAFTFFLGGFETTSSTISYCLYELALNPRIQEEAQTEIDECLSKPGGITYERISNDLKYLQMIFSETLRKHPSFPAIKRVCIEDCQLPNTNFQIKKGTGILISVSGLQRDPDIYPDPDIFDPLRFTHENIASRDSCAYIPFGDGPRFCIGSRLAVIQFKIALVALLSKYTFSVCDKTPIPINYSKRSFTQTPEEGIYLRIEKRIQ